MLYSMLFLLFICLALQISRVNYENRLLHKTKSRDWLLLVQISGGNRQRCRLWRAMLRRGVVKRERFYADLLCFSCTISSLLSFFLFKTASRGYFFTCLRYVLVSQVFPFIASPTFCNLSFVIMLPHTTAAEADVYGKITG